MFRMASVWWEMLADPRKIAKVLFLACAYRTHQFDDRFRDSTTVVASFRQHSREAKVYGRRYSGRLRSGLTCRAASAYTRRDAKGRVTPSCSDLASRMILWEWSQWCSRCKSYGSAPCSSRAAPGSAFAICRMPGARPRDVALSGVVVLGS
jgi:hypothetical protein